MAASRRSLALDVAGALNIATQSEITPLRKVAPSGEISSVFGPPPPNSLPGLNFLSWPDPAYGIAVDRQGNLYFSHRGRHQVNRLSPDGQITLIAGSGKPGISGDGGPAIEAELLGPQGVTN